MAEQVLTLDETKDLRDYHQGIVESFIETLAKRRLKDEKEVGRAVDDLRTIDHQLHILHFLDFHIKHWPPYPDGIK